MAFRQPPQLYDYAKLKTILVESGLQKTDNKLFQVINQLIDGVSQSQKVITDQIAEAVAGGGLQFVSVDDALSGDGTPASPLDVLFDGTTIQLNGSNQLEAIQNIKIAQGTLSNAQLAAGGTYTLIPLVANRVINPIYLVVYMNISNNSLTAGQSLDGLLRWGVINRTLIGIFTIITGGANGIRQSLLFSNTGNNQDANNPAGRNVELVLSGTLPTGTFASTPFSYLLVYTLNP